MNRATLVFQPLIVASLLWKYGGQLYSVAFSQAGDLNVSTHPKGVSLDTEYNVVKIDPASGKMLGRFEFGGKSL